MTDMRENDDGDKVYRVATCMAGASAAQGQCSQSKKMAGARNKRTANFKEHQTEGTNVLSL